MKIKSNRRLTTSTQMGREWVMVRVKIMLVTKSNIRSSLRDLRIMNLKTNNSKTNSKTSNQIKKKTKMILKCRMTLMASCTMKSRRTMTSRMMTIIVTTKMIRSIKQMICLTMTYGTRICKICRIKKTRITKKTTKKTEKLIQETGILTNRI